MDNIATTQAPIIKRLRALFESLMNESEIIPKAFKPVVKNLVEGYLNKADPTQVKEIIIRVRDEIIPWILREDDPDSQ
jgi:hypothetical protein